MATFPLVRGASDLDTGHKSLGGLWGRKGLAAERAGKGHKENLSSGGTLSLSHRPSPHLPARHQPAVACSGMAPGGSVPSPELPPPMSFHCFQNNSLLTAQVWLLGCFSPPGTCSPMSEGQQERPKLLLEIGACHFLTYHKGAPTVLRAPKSISLFNLTNGSYFQKREGMALHLLPLHLSKVTKAPEGLFVLGSAPRRASY